MAIINSASKRFDRLQSSKSCGRSPALPTAKRRIVLEPKIAGSSAIRALFFQSIRSWLTSGSVEFPCEVLALANSAGAETLREGFNFFKLQNAKAMPDNVPLFGLKLQTKGYHCLEAAAWISILRWTLACPSSGLMVLVFKRPIECPHHESCDIRVLAAARASDIENSDCIVGQERSEPIFAIRLPSMKVQPRFVVFLGKFHGLLGSAGQSGRH
jgi:hypothetical protein